MNIIDAVGDPKVFAQHFRGDSWSAWLVFLRALFALPMTDEHLQIYQQYTGRSSPPTAPSHEAWLIIGRRGGKSFVLGSSPWPVSRTGVRSLAPAKQAPY
jgi:hypothetical protein